MRVSVGIAAVVAIVLAAGGVYAATRPDSPSTVHRAEPNTANLWVAPTAGSSPHRCASPCAYDPAKAYGSFAAAYADADSGDLVRVKAGDYGVQAITATNQALDAPVTLEAANGEAVKLRLLTTDADWLTFKNMTIAAGRGAGRGWRSTGSHITLDNVDVTGPEATITLSGGGSDVTFKNADVGTRGNTTPRRCSFHNSEPFEVADTARLTIYNVTFWPFIPELDNPADCGGDGNMHLETVRINDNVQHLVIDRARFTDGDGSGSGRLFQSGAGGRPSSDALIVNSYFGPTNGPHGGTGATITLGIGGARCDGWVFAYNSWAQGLDDAACPVKPTYVGNLAAQPSYLPCPGSSASHNLWVWSTAKAGCGTDRWVVHPDPQQTAVDGYRLPAGAPAIDAGETELCARYTRGEDIDGNRRRGTCDAGPDEYVP